MTNISIKPIKFADDENCSFEIELPERTSELSYYIEDRKNCLGCEDNNFKWLSNRTYWKLRKENSSLILSGKVRFSLDKNIINFLAGQDKSSRYNFVLAELNSESGSTKEIGRYVFGASQFTTTRSSGNQISLEFGGIVKLLEPEIPAIEDLPPNTSDNKQKGKPPITDNPVGESPTDPKTEGKNAPLGGAEGKNAPLGGGGNYPPAPPEDEPIELPKPDVLDKCMTQLMIMIIFTVVLLFVLFCLIYLPSTGR